MSDPNSTPIMVNPSPGPDQLASAVRSLLIAVGAYGAGKGWFDASLWAALVPVLMIVGPVVWAQLKVRSSKAKMVTVAEAAPDQVAQVVKQ